MNPRLRRIDGSIDEAYVSMGIDGSAVSAFFARDVTDWVYLTLKYSYEVPWDSPEVPLELEIVEYYEDGFAFDRLSFTLTAEAEYIGATHRFGVGIPPSRKWAEGRYWVYVYQGGRKVAEVEYEVTP